MKVLPLPEDLSLHIFCMLQATRIQALWRTYSWRHARGDEWRTLRRHILHTWHRADYEALERYAQVRHEWRTEPMSWLHVDAKLATLLHSECREGYWGYMWRFL